jgi:Mor family transcriptional regulator
VFNRVLERILRQRYSAVQIILRTLYGGVSAPDQPVSGMITKEERNLEIYQRYIAGESSAALAQEFGISTRRVIRLVHRYQRRSK